MSDQFHHPNLLIQDALECLNTAEVDAEVLRSRWGLEGTEILLKRIASLKAEFISLAQPVADD